MKLISVYCVLLSACLLATAAPAGIPEPDAIAYGTVRLNDTPVTASDPVTVRAKVSVGGTDRQVASYRMGSNSVAGNNYVLRIKLESLADGSAQSGNAALIGQTAKIFAQRDGQAEVQMATFVIADRGQIKPLNLPPKRPGDVDGDGFVDVVDLLYLVDAFGSVTGDANYDDRCDFNSDGGVDVVDLLILVENFGL